MDMYAYIYKTVSATFVSVGKLQQEEMETVFGGSGTLGGCQSPSHMA